MKTLEISDRGIKLSEEGEIINQILFNEYEDIPFEVKELLSIYEELDEVTLNISIDLNEDILEEIKKNIVSIGWRVKSSKKISKTLKYLFIGILFTVCLIGIVLFFKTQKLEDKVLKLKKENLEYKKKIDILDSSITKLDEELTEPILFQKSEVSTFLIFISEVSKKNDIKFEKIEFLKGKIILNGHTVESEKISTFKKDISSHIKIKNTVFDFIKKEGEIIYFLMELKIE
ncbi:MAG: hypothetical protein ACRC5W_00140 [Cetobacterium sp.]|uniref:hypothetical protein n=1 Tax=Cetobacterium sp. TaxID=2071632 RepID=UPI003F2EFAC7